ncbi:hypothetical protein OOJ91_33970 [Micromonospora lupini]|uniref:hypothetical protein n=1 Tax=Micromonospora lupini TaxID=285679 RepID=UPI00224D3F4A|nr:hypothetical protein [Micromonospora lupini]MCX5070856.1 hypothetical protein [Micromonospora lupini]
MEEGVTISAGLVVGIAAACIWIFGNQALPRCVMIGLVTFSVGVGSTAIGGWAHDGVTWVNDQVGSLLGDLLDRPALTTPGTVLWSLAAIVLAFWVGFAFKKREIGLKVLAGTLLLPYAIATVPGKVGELGQGALETVAAVVAWPAVQLLGL